MGVNSRRDTARPVHTCPVCGKQAYRSRRDAKRASRVVNPAAHLAAYRCDTGYWHIGKLPPVIARGNAPREGSRSYPPGTTGWAERNTQRNTP